MKTQTVLIGLVLYILINVSDKIEFETKFLIVFLIKINFLFHSKSHV